MIYNYFKSGYQKLKSALQKTGSLLGDKLRTLLGKGALDEDTLDNIEQLLYEADLGAGLAQELTNELKKEYRKNPGQPPEDLIQFLQNKLVAILENRPQESITTASPHVILIVGVNGNGKTTTVAKLASIYKANGNKVLLAAADTFRAAAMEQLEIWAERLGVDIVKGKPNSDPAAVAFDAVTAGKARQTDMILIDTAGRLHTKTNLMQELEKIKRAAKKVIPESPHETFLIIDASVGQNAVEQAKIFMQYTPITGLVLTKMDGTAKGGVVINIQRQLGIPVRFLGVGEGLEDLEPFDSRAFVQELFK